MRRWPTPGSDCWPRSCRDASAPRAALAAAERERRPVDALGYAGAGSLALADDAMLDALMSPLRGEVIANNRYSADAFVVAGDLGAAIVALKQCPSDNLAVRCLAAAGL